MAVSIGKGRSEGWTNGITAAASELIADIFVENGSEEAEGEEDLRVWF